MLQGFAVQRAKVIVTPVDSSTSNCVWFVLHGKLFGLVFYEVRENMFVLESHENVIQLQI